MSETDRTLRRFYEDMADDYAARLDDWLDHSDFDLRWLEEVRSRGVVGGPVLDLGCGPGQAARRFAAHGIPSVGIDFAPGVLVAARRRHPTTTYVAGDLRRLPLRAASCAGAVALYVLQHLPRAEVPALLAEVHRVLRVDAPLLIGTHEGTGEYLVDTSPVPNTLYEAAELEAALQVAGFTTVRIGHRGPLPGELSLDRTYVLSVRSHRPPA